MISPNDTDTACVESWRHWCETNGVDFIWNKQIISKYMNSYDKIGIVGSKTMIKWDAENIFDKFDDLMQCLRDKKYLKHRPEDIRQWTIDKFSYTKMVENYNVVFDKVMNDS